MTRWDKIVQLRNSSVHGKLKKNDRLTTKNIITVINQSLLVFSQLQNRYNKESSDYKYATENKRKYLESITKDDSAA